MSYSFAEVDMSGAGPALWEGLSWFATKFGYGPFKGTDAYWDKHATNYDNPQTQADEKARIRDEMLGSPEGLQALARRPSFGGAVLAATDPDRLDRLNLDEAFGDAKDSVLGHAVIAATNKGTYMAGQGFQVTDRDKFCDSALLYKLAKQLGPGALNDRDRPGGALGARVYQKLFIDAKFDQVCELVDDGVDTKLTAPAQGSGGGLYSGFAQPLQHVCQKYLREIDLVDHGKKAEVHPPFMVEGARKVLQKLGDKAVTCTSYEQVKGSPMITAFQERPGTIWGFEDIRLPYVEAAHDTDKGAQPVRMMELWDAVRKILDSAPYEQMLGLATPEEFDQELEKLVQSAKSAVEKDLDTVRSAAKYHTVKAPGKRDEYMRRFEEDARTLLRSILTEMPVGTAVRPVPAKGGQKPFAEVAGVGAEKLMSGFACKAGLWWAKSQEKPVYYCLDGLEWDDVTNYKQLKNRAIEAALSGEGAPHHTVITIVEVREILKNWDEFRNTVKFSRKGQLLTPEEAEKEVQDCIKKMKAADTQAGRAPAPPMATFAGELDALDTALLPRLQAGLDGATENERKERDKDARDIVRKSNYFVKIAKTRQNVVLKYLISKCQVLIKYGLISDKIPDLATGFAQAKDEQAKQIGAQLLAEVNKCHAKFRGALSTALKRHPVLAGL